MLSRAARPAAVPGGGEGACAGAAFPRPGVCAMTVCAIALSAMAAAAAARSLIIAIGSEHGPVGSWSLAPDVCRDTLAILPGEREEGRRFLDRFRGFTLREGAMTLDGVARRDAGQVRPAIHFAATTCTSIDATVAVLSFKLHWRRKGA